MTRQDSIRTKGLQPHVDAWCEQHKIKYTYGNLVEWLENGDEFGEAVPILKLARLFKTTRSTMEKWVLIYNEEKVKA